MKTTIKPLLAGLVAVFGCSVSNAQYSNAFVNATLIYSNSFGGSGSVNLTNTLADYGSGLFGGSNTATAAWLDLSGIAHTNYFYADGSVGVPQGGNLALPFTPASNHVYALYVTWHATAAPGSWVAAGFDGFYVNGAPSGRSQFNSSGTAGYDWMLQNYGSSAQAFLGPGGATGITGPNNNIAGADHSMLVILDSTFYENSSNMWVTAKFNDGQLTGTQIYTVNSGSSSPLSIRSVDIGQNGMAVDSEHNYRWTSFLLVANQELIINQPVSAGVNEGTAFTNSVLVGGTPPFFYQWYTNDAPIGSATNASLIFSSVTAANTCTNYYVVVTNLAYGAVTSAAVSLNVYTNPTFLALAPVAYTNPITLFGGTNVAGNYGSSPTFSVSAAGLQPITYQWWTNGAQVGGATNASFMLTNCQSATSPTNVAIVASNSDGATSNAWSVSYVQAPAAPFPQRVLALAPAGFWRLNESPDDSAGDVGTLCLDYGSGNNAGYTNVYLADPAYTNSFFFTNAEPGSYAINVGSYPSPSGAFGIQGINFAATNANAAFSAGAWVDGAAAQAAANAIIAKGNSGAEQFYMDVSGGKFRFSVRDASGVLHTAVAGRGPTGTNWTSVIGVCNEAATNVSIYLDGVLSGSTFIATNVGVASSSLPMSIGAERSTTTGNYDRNFQGDLADVAVWNYALSSAQIAHLLGDPIILDFVPPLPPTNWVFLRDRTLAISAQVFGQAPFGYYWTNVTAGGILQSGNTNATGILNVSLNVPNASSNLSGNVVKLVVTNALASTNVLVSLFCPAAPIPLDYSNPILYSNYFDGGTWSIGGMPLTAANLLMGGTNATWVDALGTNDLGSLQASGVSASASGNTWLVPLKPHAGYVYTATATVTLSANQGNWVTVGFANPVPTNATAGRVNDIGYDFMILNWGGNVQYFSGLGTGGTTVTNAVLATGSFPGTHVMQVVLDTTGSQWVMYGFIDGVATGTNVYSSNPPITGVGIGQNAPITGADVQWNSFTVIQTSSGAPPYLLDPQPPASVTNGAGTTLSISASAFGGVPIGYYWSNTVTASVIASGSTNAVAPLIANLSYSNVPSSWDGSTLALVVTNASGTSIALVSLTVTNSAPSVYTNKPTITGFSLVNGTNVMISATNGQSGCTYYLLSSTNLAIPLGQWLPLATNVILTNGSAANGFIFIGTNAVRISDSQRFYLFNNTN